MSFIVTFERGSGVRSASLSTADLICNDEFNEANEEFILLLEIVNSGSEDVQLESEGNGILIFVIEDDDGRAYSIIIIIIITFPAKYSFMNLYTCLRNVLLCRLTIGI